MRRSELAAWRIPHGTRSNYYFCAAHINTIHVLKLETSLLARSLHSLMTPRAQLRLRQNFSSSHDNRQIELQGVIIQHVRAADGWLVASTNIQSPATGFVVGMNRETITQDDTYSR